MPRTLSHIFALAQPVPGSTPRAARSIERILMSAAQLFGQEGYERASMGAVARAAGVSKGLLHYHFRSKDHLLIEASRATFREIHTRFEERFSRGEKGLETALDGLDSIWHAIRDMRSWVPFMLETMSIAAQDRTVRKDLQSFQNETISRLEDGIRRVR
jgi:AcrR family transcriptional regulator